ncbi:dihydrofolate reductase family protein [Maricaulis sp.]|uniref:dihydrofolate reductase family protein n=1 Tax=Maricaulis sp. TaxID=1486257 RepID=UPI002602773B|nr:dihydrofolate reductase family protein [Maricaulis sp.]
MASLIVYTFLSLDGFFEGPPGHEMDFVQSGFLPTMEADIADQYRTVEAFVMGRRTFDSLAGYWPTPAAAGEPLVDDMNGRTKLVVSSNPDTSAWDNSEHLGRDPLTALKARQTAATGDLMVIGSGQVVRGLTAAGMVDAFRFLVFPVLLGRGRRLFETMDSPCGLTLERHHAFENGTLALHYRSRPAPA